jgi:hypothetical protein
MACCTSPCTAPDDKELVVETVSWPVGGALVLGCVAVEGDEEDSDAHVLELNLGGWDPGSGPLPPDGGEAALLSFTPLMVEVGAQALTGWPAEVRNAIMPAPGIPNKLPLLLV